MRFYLQFYRFAKAYFTCLCLDPAAHAARELFGPLMGNATLDLDAFKAVLAGDTGDTSIHLNPFTDLNPPEASRWYSSVWDDNAIGIGHARSMLGSEQAWSAKHPKIGEWMVIDIMNPSLVTGVIVQSRGHSCQVQKVTVISVSVGNARDGPWTECGEYPCRTSHEYQLQRVMLSHAVLGRYVRLKPMSWEQHISMRAGVIKGVFAHVGAR